jgi:4'-phosphopantetheinyl transferase
VFLSITQINLDPTLKERHKRPSLTTRRKWSLTLARSLLVNTGILTEKQAEVTEIRRYSSGKPYLTTQAPLTTPLPAINLSHAGSWVACLLSDHDHPACIDLEDLSIKRPYQQLAAYAFSEQEAQFVQKSGKIAFYKLWTAKEAIAKCQGMGLYRALTIDFGNQLFDSPLDFPVHVTLEGEAYYLYQHHDETYFYTIAQKAINSTTVFDLRLF